MRATPKVEIWKSPIPYLFGGLFLLILLIALALLSLVCTNKKTPSSSSSNDTNPVGEEDDTGDNKAKSIMVEYLPKIVVILAGEDKPSCLAVPVIPPPSSVYPCNCGNVTVVST
ncbi:Protein GLUTAMINE DUMPER 6 [Hirschfeldia incana]|nr:Protein GLUTAMINE DUMPER 6 [Hirschfeldia incana]